MKSCSNIKDQSDPSSLKHQLPSPSVTFFCNQSIWAIRSQRAAIIKNQSKNNALGWRLLQINWISHTWMRKLWSYIQPFNPCFAWPCKNSPFPLNARATDPRIGFTWYSISIFPSFRGLTCEMFRCCSGIVQTLIHGTCKKLTGSPLSLHPQWGAKKLPRQGQASNRNSSEGKRKVLCFPADIAAPLVACHSLWRPHSSARPQQVP